MPTKTLIPLLTDNTVVIIKDKGTNAQSHYTVGELKDFYSLVYKNIINNLRKDGRAETNHFEFSLY